jgi:hypothetical protein
MKEILLWLLDRGITAIPGFLLRVFYPPRKVANKVKIELRGENPINPCLGSSVPRIDLYLEVTNLSNLDLTLDRMLLDLWFGQPVLNGAILNRCNVPAKSTVKNLFFRSALTTRQIQQIKPYLQESPPSGSISLSVHAYFNSKIGSLEVEGRFERRKV